jgi:hypothetical protein
MSGSCRIATVALVMLVAVAGSAVAAPPPGSSREEYRDYYARQLVDTVANRVERDRACRLRSPAHGPVSGPPSTTFRNTIAALRRPAQPNETVDYDTLFRPGPLPTFYAGWTRVLTAADGTSFTLFPIRDLSSSKPRPARCVVRLRAVFRGAVAHRSAAFRRAAKKALRFEITEYWSPRRREGLLLDIGGTGGPAASLAILRRGGVMMTTSGPASRFYELVPDPVATVEFTIAAGGSDERVSVPVHDNLVAVPEGLSFWARQVWRAADGRVIRVLPGT